MSTITAAAVYPVTGAYATTPAMSGTFIPTIWSSKLNVKFYAATTFGDISNTNWEGDIKNVGDKVIINNIPSITINAYTVGSTLNYEVPSPNVIELQIDTGWYFGFSVSDVLEYQSSQPLMEMFSADAGQQLKIKVDKECIRNTFANAAAANVGATAGVISGSYNLGTALAPVTLTGANILQVLTALGGVLDEQNVPETERFLVITPVERQILMQSNLAQAQFMGDSQSMVRNGKIGRIDRFDVYVSNLLPTGAAGKDYIAIDGTEATVSNALKRHAVIAGHKSALTFASQINKVETLPNPSDFGQLIRGLMVYGKKVAKPEALTYAQVAG